MTRPWKQNPGSVATVLHDLPHPNHFNMKAARYKHGLKVLAFQPIFFGLLALIPLMLFTGFRLTTKERAKTYSKTKNLQYTCVLVILGALVVLLVLELVVHSQLLKHLASVVIDIEAFPYVEQEIEKYFGKLEFIYDLETSTNGSDKWKSLARTEQVGDLHRLYHQLVREVVEATNRVTKEKAIMLPRTVQTPLKQAWLVVEWMRFLVSVVWWSCGVGLAVALLHAAHKSYVLCGCCGVMHSLVAAGAVLAQSVALADLCFEPIDGLTNLQPVDHEFYMNKIQEKLCLSWQNELQRRVRVVQQLMNRAADVATWHENKDRLLQRDSDYMNIDSSWPTNSTFKTRSSYSAAWRGYFCRKEVSALNDLILGAVECYALDEFVDDASEVCEQDRMLTWLMLQLVPLLVMAIASYVLLLLGISRMRHIKHYAKKMNIELDYKMPEICARVWRRFLIHASTTLICEKCCDEMYVPPELKDEGTDPYGAQDSRPGNENYHPGNENYRPGNEYPSETVTDDEYSAAVSSGDEAERRGERRGKREGRGQEDRDTERPRPPGDCCHEVRFREPPPLPPRNCPPRPSPC